MIGSGRNRLLVPCLRQASSSEKVKKVRTDRRNGQPYWDSWYKSWVWREVGIVSNTYYP